MALHTDTEIYRSTYDLAKLVTTLVANMPRNYKADFGTELRRRCMALVMRTYEANSGNSYLGLARQAGNSHQEQALICRALLKRGHAVEGLHLSKAFRKKA